MSNTVSVEAFTQQAREFLERNAERKEAAKAFVWGEGSDNVAMFEERLAALEGALRDVVSRWKYRGQTQ